MAYIVQCCGVKHRENAPTMQTCPVCGKRLAWAKAAQPISREKYKAVAKATGYKWPTVAQVLQQNQSSGVADSTRRAIVAAALKLGVIVTRPEPPAKTPEPILPPLEIAWREIRQQIQIKQQD